MIGNSQQLRKFEAQSGYPLDSETLNAYMDAAVYDLIQIIETPTVVPPAVLLEILEDASLLDTISLFDFTKDTVVIQKQHTADWRTL